MPTFRYKPVTHGRLPHIAPADRTLFVTSRLAGSLPQNLIKDYKQKRQLLHRELIRIRRRVQSDSSPTMRECLLRLERFKEEWFVKFDKLMDQASHGPTWLKDERVASIVTEKLHEADGESSGWTLTV